MRKRNKVKLFWAIGILAVLCLATLVYLKLSVYPAAEAAFENLQSDDTVTVTKWDSSGYYFDGPDADSLIVMYPGALVEPEAYAELCRGIASADADVFLLRAPMDLAILDIDAADKVLEELTKLTEGTENEYEHLYVAGHSIGASVSCMYAAKHLEELDGVITLAGYSTKDLHRSGFSMLSVYGSNDGHVAMLQKHPENRPDDYTEVVIDGGNHAQFGDYGVQKRDGIATISSEEQKIEAMEAIHNYISSHENE